MRKEYCMKIVDYDEQHHLVACAQCHAAMQPDDVMVPTNNGMWECLDCADRSTAKGMPALALTILGAIES